MDPIIPSEHFLSLPRPNTQLGTPIGVVDTSTLAAHDFDVDTRTGFMPPQPPLTRLPVQWEPWELALDNATSQRIQLGDKKAITELEKTAAEVWRSSVRNLPIIAIDQLIQSEIQLRRAHHVLGWILHFYAHSLPPDADIVIPPAVSLPLCQVSAQLQLPPVLTYSDDVLYNWGLYAPSSTYIPAFNNLRSLTLFTGTLDEQEFFLASARIEFRGVEALDLMGAIMDEAFVGDDIAIRRITTYLTRLALVIDELKVLLQDVRKGCDPEVFYHQIRPWFKGSDDPNRPWTFEGLELDPTLQAPTELLGASAGQSTLIHAFDVFLGVDSYPHRNEAGPSASASAAALLKRMRLYMPRHHRQFLQHLSANPRPLREMVAAVAAGSALDGGKDAAILKAYNAAVTALKLFRDAHMIVVAIYIIGPARRHVQTSVVETAAAVVTPAVVVDDENGGSAPRIDALPTLVVTTKEASGEPGAPPQSLKGTGGTDLSRFLKGVRDHTAETRFPEYS